MKASPSAGIEVNFSNLTGLEYAEFSSAARRLREFGFGHMYGSAGEAPDILQLSYKGVRLFRWKLIA